MKRQSIETPSVQSFYLGSLDTTVGTFVQPFRFAAPGPRAMLTVKLLVTSSKLGVGSPFDWTFAGTASWFLWLCRTILTNDGQRVPVQNLLGTRATPARLDNGTTTDSVNGASFDWTGGGDGVDGELTFVTSAGSGESVPTFASLRGRYNAVAPLCDEEWLAILSRAMNSPDANRRNLGTPNG